MKSLSNVSGKNGKSRRSLDLIFFALVVATCFIAYAVPLMAFPSAPSNPWPYAYNVIQQQIIEKGMISVQTPQFGAWQRSDHTWFLLHHVPYVSLELLTGMSFETMERLLSCILSVAFFMGFYFFAKKAFGNTLGFVGSLFMLFVPRTHNYLVTVNGEFIGWLILFPALTMYFEYAKKRDRKYLILSAFLASFLPLSNLMVFAEYSLIVGAYCFSELVAKRNLRRLLESALVIVLLALIIPLPVLYASGDLYAGESSTIGSLFASKSPREAEFERIYYDQFGDYWKLYANKLPIWTELTYVSSDYIFLFGTGFILVFYVPLSLIGTYFSLKNHKEPRLLFPLLWIILQVALDTILLSLAFGPTVNAAGIRMLLYFGWALSLLSGFGLYHVVKKLRLVVADLEVASLLTLRGIWRNRKPILLLVFAVSFVSVGAWAAKRNAGFANSYNMLYAQEYSDALIWLRENTPKDAVIIANDWSGGEIWLKAHRLALIEGGKGSATYITYEEIVTKLQDVRTIFRGENLSETIALMKKYKAEWILIWDKPSAYQLNITPLEQVDMTRFNSTSQFVKVFEEKKAYNPPEIDAYGYSYTAHAIIYYHPLNYTRSFRPSTNQSANQQYDETSLELSPLLRFLSSFILVLFLPGYAWISLLLADKKAHAPERILLSIALSFALVSVTYFWLNLAGLKITFASTLIVTLILTLVPAEILAVRRQLRIRRIELTKSLKDMPD